VRVANRRFKFQKRSQLFIGTQNVTLAAVAADYGQHWSLNRWIQTALSNSTNAVSISSACTTKRFPSSRCASAIEIASRAASDKGAHLFSIFFSGNCMMMIGCAGVNVIETHEHTGEEFKEW
jgi:hypothetical protein